MTDIRHIFFCFGLLLMLAACGSSDDMGNVMPPDIPVSGDEQSKVSLAFSLSSSAGQTRSSAEIAQASGFRGITTPTFLAFLVGQEGDNAYPASVSGASGIDGKNAKFFFYNDFQLPIGTSALLVYAKATPVNDKAVNGSTISTIPTNTNPAAITFSPYCIYSGTTVHADAQAIADYLTAIANTPNWEGSSYDELRQNFIGKGAVAPTLIAGSSASVNAYVDKLIVELNKSGDSDLKTAILAKIADKPDQLKDATKYYPASIGLPDGVAALEWDNDNKKFVPQTTTTLKDVNSLNVFAYPAELCYYCNSQIKTSESMIGHTDYTSATDWKKNVLPNYTDGQIITSTTKSVAIEKPLQYGVARLDVTIQAKTTKLKDGDNIDITIGETSFPLTGIIVGGQRRVGFDYKPLNSADAQSLVYDSQVKKDNNSSAYLLSTAPTATDAVHTLLLQSLDGEDETIILEFENNCKDGDNNGVTFKGIDGLINPGTKFYLIGTILKPTEEEGKDYTKRVFTQDYITSANITIESLSHAYNAVPDLYYDALTSFHVVNIDIKPWSESSTSHSVYNW